MKIYLNKNGWLFLVLFLISCEKDGDYAPELNQYVDSFVSEARKRNVKVDKSKIKIVLDEANGAAGVCVGGNLIRINQDVWKHMMTYNDQTGGESLIFHELGHCVLKRPHLNDTLPNGDVKSMMAGVEVEDNPSGNADFALGFGYRGFRRDYYRDELFGKKPSTPWWAEIEKIDTRINSRNLVFIEDFSGVKELITEGQVTTEVRDGFLHCQSSNSFGIITPATLLAFVEKNTNLKNYEIETSVKMISGDFGIDFYATESNINNVFRNLIWQWEGQKKILGSSNSFFCINNISEKNTYKLKVRRLKDIIYCFLDDKLQYVIDIEPDDNQIPKPIGSYNVKYHTSLILGQNSIASFDYVAIYSIE